MTFFMDDRCSHCGETTDHHALIDGAWACPEPHGREEMETR